MNAKSAQILAAVLGFLLIVLIGALIFILLSRPAQGPRVSPTPTAAAVVSPSVTVSPSLFPTLTPFPTLSPSLLPSITPVPLPTATAEITPAITPEITPVAPTAVPTITAPPTPTPSPTAPPIPTSPDRQIRVMDFGLDGQNPELGDFRYIQFRVDGPSIIRVTLSNSSGRARICLWQGDDVESCANTVRTMRNGVVERAVFDAGQTSWTVRLIGVEQAIGPVLDIDLDFNAIAPQVEFRNLRWQGQPSPNYNGVTAAVDVTPGQVAINGQFEFAQQKLWRVAIQAAGEGVIRDESGGPSSTFSLTHDVTADTTYIVTAENPNPAAEPGPVFANVTIAWP